MNPILGSRAVSHSCVNMTKKCSLLWSPTQDTLQSEYTTAFTALSRTNLWFVASAMVKSKILKQLRKQLDKAEKIENPVQYVEETKRPKFQLDEQSRERNGSPVATQSLSYVPSEDLSEEDLDSCLNLFRANMGQMYLDSSWGLDMTKKAAEFQHRKARFVLIHQINSNAEDNHDIGSSDRPVTASTLAAFVHFRFEYDDNDDPSTIVLYIYEIQVAEAYRRKGLGQKLMALMEQIGCAVQMSKILLTVFKKNTQAMQFYTEKLCYGVDESSPSKFGKFADYEILSKPL